ncbi:hypothetical protein K474DRAFT_1711220 [Panus rudis PR-1116 ss-1]|nr:hypothetical protein K474DRAFT_1711220 [Panus rudis PR-1116 ss-1]
MFDVQRIGSSSRQNATLSLRFPTQTDSPVQPDNALATQSSSSNHRSESSSREHTTVVVDKRPRPKVVARITPTHHIRSQSAATSPAITQPTASHIRARSMSTSTASQRTARSRVYSFSRLGDGGVPKAEPALPEAVETDDTMGSFTPTSCPRQRLHSLLGTSSDPRFSLPFTLRGAQRKKLRLVTCNFDDSATSPDPLEPHLPSHLQSSSPDSPLPSICRTPSEYTESEYFPTAPSSAGPLTPAQSASPSPSIRKSPLHPHPRSHSPLTSALAPQAAVKVPKALEAIESKSRFRTVMPCSTCRKPGSNYPTCPRCGEMWCSRECRLKGGKRHVCSGGVKA